MLVYWDPFILGHFCS